MRAAKLTFGEKNKMAEEKNAIFVWKDFVFFAYISHSQLFLKWRSISKRSLPSGNEESDQDEGETTPESSPKFCRAKSNSKSQGNCWTSLKLDKWQCSELVREGFLLDSDSFQRVPVLLLKCSNEENRLEYAFVEVKDTSSRSAVSYCAQLAGTVEGGRNIFSLFMLVPVRLYSFVSPCDLVASSQSHSVFLPYFQLLLLNSDKSSPPLKLCAKDAVSHKSRIQNFDIPARDEAAADLKILDTFSYIEDGALIALVSYKTGEGLTQCQCLKFSSCDSQTHGKIESYNMEQLPVEIFFEPSFVEVLKIVNILTFATIFDLCSKSHSFSTAVIMVTLTGYAVKFSNGVLLSCVNLFDPFTENENTTESWSAAFVKIIDMVGCHERTAVQINSICHLIDWIKGKVVRTWQSVISAESYDINPCGVSSLILVLESGNTCCAGTSDLHHLLDEAELRVIDVDEFEAGHVDTEHVGIVYDSDMVRHKDIVSVEDEFVNQSHCAMNALKGQMMKCESSVTEMRSELASKMFFLSDTWQKLSNLHTGESGQNLAPETKVIEPPLVVLAAGSLSDSHCGHGPQQPVRKYVETGHVWKRTVDSVLVVGMLVQNVSKRPLTDIVVSLVPASDCHTESFESISKCWKMSDTDPSETGAESVSFGQNSELSSKCFLLSGLSVVATCTADISKTFSASELKLHVFLSYTVINSDCSVQANLTVDEHSQVECEDYITELTITVHDVLNGIGRIEISKSITAGAPPVSDLLVLDCVQRTWTLVVRSMISSVTCLTARLSSQSCVVYLEWAKQFLFVDTHWLKYCRIRALEQLSKHEARIKVFARSDSEVLLLIKFLYSFLPEDITITSDTSSRTSAVKFLGQAVLHDTDSKVKSVKLQIESLTATKTSHTENVPEDEPLSPTFHTARKSSMKPAFTRSVHGKPDHEREQPLEESGSRTTEIGCERNSTEGERELFRRAKKRFREKWGDDDN